MKRLKEPDFYRFLLITAFLTMMIYFSVYYINAAWTYEQQIPFKHICILLGLICITLMDVKSIFNLFSILYLPICFVVTRTLYIKQIIPDPCKYLYPELIRLSKVNIAVWGYLIICLIREWIKNKTLPSLKGPRKLFLILFCVYAVWLSVFQRERYTYVLLISIGISALFYLLRHETRRRYFITALQYAFVLASFYVFYQSILYRPYDTDRYNGFFGNSNMGGYFYTCTLLALFSIIYNCWHTELKKAIKIPVLIVLFLYTGFVGAINIFNYTRTTLTGMLFGFAVLFVLELIRNKKKGTILLRYLLIPVSIALLFNLTYMAIRYIPAKVNDPHFFTWECNEEINVLKDEPVDSPKYTSMTQFLRTFFGKWGIYIKVDDVEENEFEKEHGNDGITIDTSRDVTNGRTEIWKAYLPLMNAFGHEEGHIYMPNGDLMYHAHNTYFQVAYQFGIPAGILHLLLNGSCFLFACYMILKKKELTAGTVFSFLIISTNLIGQLTEWMGHPAYMICFSLFMCYAYIFQESGSTNNKEMKECTNQA